MKSSRIVLAIGILALATPVSAQVIYKCVDASGQTIYTNIDCPAKAKVKSARAYQPEPDSQTGWATKREESYGQPSNDGGDHHYVDSGGQVAQQARQQAVGYRCSVNGSTWVQASPCPASATSTHYEPVTGTVVGTGEFVTGTQRVQTTTAVESTSLSREDVCTHLENGAPMSNSSGKKDDFGRKDNFHNHDAYDRNAMREKTGC